MGEVILKTKNLKRILDEEVPVTLVDNINIEIRRGEFVTITGPSGSGKSSLLYLLGLLDSPTEGEVILHGKNVDGYDDDELADVRLQEIGFVFQFHFLLPEFSALENLLLPMRRLGNVSEKEMKQRAVGLLTDVGLADHMHKKPKQMSGGQCQRVAVARALANNPKLILCDEPTGNLDTASSENVQNILRDLAHRHNRAVVAVTHDPKIAESADRVIRIVDGKVAV